MREQMRIYHGSIEKVEKPEIRILRNRTLDYGYGFYTTTSYNQAKDWVRRRMDNTNAPKGFVNIYEFDKKALNLLNQGFLHVIGSDCHNTSSRPPKIGSAFELIEKKFGARYLRGMDDFGRSLLGK